MSDKGQSRIVNIIITSSLAIATVACIVPLFIKQMNFIPNLLAICILSFILMAVTTLFQLRKPRYSILFLVLAMIMIRVFFDLTVLPVRANEGGAPANKNAALELARLSAGKPVNLYMSTFFPMQSVFYLERERNEILLVRQEAAPGELYIAEKSLLRNYVTRRGNEAITINPFHPVSDPYSGDDQAVFSGYLYQTVFEFELQKHSYLLLIPTRME